MTQQKRQPTAPATQHEDPDRPFTKTVKCFTDQSLTRHFWGVEDAAAYANELLAQGHKVQLQDYRKPRRYVDYIAERGRQ